MNLTHTSTLVEPPEGHSSLFFTRRGTCSSDDSSSSTPPPPPPFPPPVGLPVESFLTIMDHLPEKDLVRASQVCWNWRKEIIACSRLWDELKDVKVANMNTLDRVRAFVSRSKGKLRKLDLNFEPEGDLELSMLPLITMPQMFHEISRLDGARALRKLVLDLRPYRHEDDLEPAYKCIALSVQFAEFSAVNLVEFKLFTCLPRFPSGACLWFSLIPLKYLAVTCRGNNDDDGGGMGGGRQLPDFFSTVNAVSSTQLSTSKLEKIFFVNTSLKDATYPTFTHLTILRLYEMNVLNLYGLLSKCSSTLEVLELRGVTSDSPSKYLPNPTPNVAIANNNKDVPPVLSLPVLKKVQLCGSETPLLWVAPSDDKSSFMTDTPSLSLVDFGPKPFYRHLEDYDENDDDDDDDEISACQSLDSQLLINLFRRSPIVSAINFKRTNLSSSMLLQSLPDCSSNYLKHLSIGGTTACQDSTVDRLASLVPGLKELDCFDEAWQGDSERTVSVQALGRFAKNMLEVAAPMRSLAGGGGNDWCLEITADGDFRHSETSISDLRNSLKDLVVTLSASQLSHLGSSLVFNPCPIPSSNSLVGSSSSSSSSLLSFSSIKAELEELVTPPNPPPFKGPFPAKPGEQGYVKPEPASPVKMVKKRRSPGSGEAKEKEKEKMKRPKKKVSKIAAPQAVVDQAESLLQKWVTERERQACLEWFEEQEQDGKIEIRFGNAGCHRNDYDCCRIGGEMWADSDSSDEENADKGSNGDSGEEEENEEE